MSSSCCSLKSLAPVQSPSVVEYPSARSRSTMMFTLSGMSESSASLTSWSRTSSRLLSASSYIMIVQVEGGGCSVSVSESVSESVSVFAPASVPTFTCCIGGDRSQPDSISRKPTRITVNALVVIYASFRGGSCIFQVARRLKSGQGSVESRSFRNSTSSVGSGDSGCRSRFGSFGCRMTMDVAWRNIRPDPFILTSP